MPNNIILDATLFVRLDLTDSRRANEAFRANPLPRGQLANVLLLYDTVAIPTYDFGIVPTLVQWLGHDCYLDALGTDAFKFVRRRGLLGYAGNGNSISTFLIGAGRQGSFSWWQEAVFGLTPDSLERQVENGLAALPAPVRAGVIEETARHVLEPGYDNEFFVKNIVEESYKDVLKTPWLVDLVKREFPGSDIDLQRLPSVGPAQMRVLGDQGIRDSADLLLRVADVNMELFLAAAIGYADLYSIAHAEELLRAKLARCRVAPAAVAGFMKLLALNNLPDVAAAVSGGHLTLQQVIELRQHPDATAFRRWLQTVPVVDADALVAAYIKALESEARPQSWPVRTLRLALTTAIGALNPAAGLAAAVVDTYFLDKWLAGYSPRLFLDRVTSLDLPG